MTGNGFATADLLADLFRGRQDRIAYQWQQGERTGFSHKPPEKSFRDYIHDDHLTGKTCLGFYLTLPGDNVFCSCVDFDGNPAKPDADPDWQDKAIAVALCLENVGIPHLVEVSQSGAGAHVWIFFDALTPAWLARAFWRVIGKTTGIAFKEIYPRQDYLTGKELGNLVRFPMWGASRFIEADGWTDLPIESLKNVKRTNETELREKASELGVHELRPQDRPNVESEPTAGTSSELPESVLRLLRQGGHLFKRWSGDTSGMKDNSRSALCQAIANELVRLYVPPVDIKSALLAWCREHGYDKGDRPEWIAGLVTKAQEYAAKTFIPPASANVESKPQYQWEPINAPEFAKGDYRPNWLIPKILVAKQPAICGGPQKSLKTSVCGIDLAISLASATDYLGHFPVPNKKRVALVSGESGPGALQETSFRVCKAKGILLEGLGDYLQMVFRIPQLANDDQLNAMVNGLKENGSEVVVIDPLYLSLLAGVKDLSASNLYDIGPLLLRVAEACLNFGVTPILLHHGVKASATKFEPLTLADLAFSGVAEFARQWVLLSRRQAYESGSGNHKLWMVVGGSVGHNGCYGVDVDEGQLQDDFTGRTWEVSVIPASEVRDAEKEEKQSAREEANRIKFQKHESDLLVALDNLIKSTGNEIVPRKRVEDCSLLPRRPFEVAETRLIADKVIERQPIDVETGNGGKRSNGVGLRRVKSSDK